MRGATAAVNLVGILDGSAAMFDAVHARGAGHVAQAAAKAGADRFVQVSAIGADAQSPAAYARSKAAGEAAVRAAFPTATVVRPSIVFGREDAFLNRFAGMARSMPFMMPVVAGKTKFQPVYVGDVAAAITAALGDPATFGGQTYELGGPRVYSFRDLLAWILREVRVDKPLVEVPDAVAATMARMSGVLPGMPMTQDQWRMLQSDNVATGDGLAAFGITATPMEAIAPAYLERFRSAGRFHREAAV
jgi:NADH dehydrogenase